MKTVNQHGQVLRGIAIVAVVFIHTCPKDPAWQIGFRPLVNFGVPMFLFLSGWLTRQKPQPWGTICRKRIPRVLVPYLIWTVIYTLVAGQPRALAYNLLFANAVYTLYYIPVYIQLVLLTPLVKRLAESRLHWVGWLVTPLSFILFTYQSGRFGDILNQAYYLSFLGWFSYYYMGFICGQKQAISVNCHRFARYLLPLFLLAQVGEGYLWWKAGLADCGTPMKLTALLTNLFLMAALVPWLHAGNHAYSIAFRTLGDYSFGIYLIHPLAIQFLPGIPFCINTVFVLGISYITVRTLHHIIKDKAARWVGLI